MSYKGIFRKAGINISGKTLSLQDGYKFNLGGTTSSTPIYIDNVGDTSSIAMDMIAAYLGHSIKTGDYQSTADGGVILAAANTYNAAFLADDSGSNIPASVRNVLARTLLTVDQSGGSIRSLMGQLKLLDGVDVSTGVYTGVQGYVELPGDSEVKSGAKASGMDISVEVASGKTLTIASGGIFAGLKIETTGAGSLSNSGDCAAIFVESAGSVTDWPVGLDLNDITTGINIGACTDGIVISGACADNAIEIASTVADCGVKMSALSTGGQGMSITFSGTCDEAAAADAAMVHAGVTSVANAGTQGDMAIGFNAAMVASTADQANNIIIGYKSYATISKNVDAVYGYLSTILCNDAGGVIDSGVYGMRSVIDVTEAITVSAGEVACFAALWSSDSAVTTAETMCFHGDVDDDIDKGIDFDVATGKTCTTGIELGVTGTGAYTTGINLSGGCATGISITNPTTKAIGVTNSTAVTGLDAVTVAETYTKVDGWHVGIRSNLTYTPAGGTGYAGIYPLYAKGVLDGTFSGGTEYFFAAKLRLDLTASAVCDSAGSFFDPLILQITANSGATMTAGMTSFLHLQWSSDKSFAGIFNSGTMNPSTWIYVDAMAKGAVVPPDSVFCIRSYLTPYLFDFNNLAMCASLSDTGGTAGADCVGHIKIRWNGADAYINVFSDNS